MTRRALQAGILFLLLTGFCSAQQSWNSAEFFSQTPALQPGGDVLRPGGAGLPWYLGIDGGVTYSSFYNGPILLFPLKNPYNPLTLAQRAATANTGGGLGFYFGAAIDVPLSKSIGLAGKVSYNTRRGDFTSNIKGSVLYPLDTTDYSQTTTWTFRYISVDILLRFQLIEKSLYLLVGPSFNSLSGNTAKLDEKILDPNTFYVEADGTLTNRLTSLSSETEIGNVEKTRWELKVGAGWWIPLDKKLYLTPEVLFGIPLTKLLQPWTDPTSGLTTSTSFNHWTLYGTIGLRWQI